MCLSGSLVGAAEILVDETVSSEPRGRDFGPRSGGELPVDSEQFSVTIAFATVLEIVLSSRVSVGGECFHGSVAVDERVLGGVADGVEVAREY